MLLASVALPVNTSSFGWAFMSDAIVVLEFSSAVFASLPCLWRDIVFPYFWVK